MKKYILLIVMSLSAIVSVLAADTPKFLDPNKVWEYGYEAYDMFSPAVNGSLYRYEIDGIVEYRGKTYQVLWQTQEITWDLKDRDESNNYFEVDTIHDKIKIALLREEDNRVYMPYLSDGPILYKEKIFGARSIPNYEYQIETDENTKLENALWNLIPDDKSDLTFEVVELNENDEILLFDFNAKKGEKINLWGFPDYPVIVDSDLYPYQVIQGYTPCLFEYTVDESNTKLLNINNEQTESTTIKSEFLLDDRINVYEYNTCAGSIGNSAFIFGPVLAIDALPNGLIRHFWFNNLYDKEGNIIFEGENIKVPDNNAGVEAVKADERGDGRMYDVLGREVSDPQPGTIYIQNGRKFIAW